MCLVRFKQGWRSVRGTEMKSPKATEATRKQAGAETLRVIGMAGLAGDGRGIIWAWGGVAGM